MPWMPWDRWMRNLEPVISSNIHRIVPVNIRVMSATAGWRQTNRRTRRRRTRYRDTVSSLSALSHALSLASLFAAVSLSSCIKFHQQEDRHGWWVWALSCSVLSFSCCFVCVCFFFPRLLLWFCIGCESGFSVENNRSRYASFLHESVYTLYVFFLWSLLSGVGLWIWFGLVWFFFFGWMGKVLVLELLMWGFTSQRGTSYDDIMYQEF
jgi:hypothetical protein